MAGASALRGKFGWGSAHQCPSIRCMASNSLVDAVQQKNGEYPVIVYSKTYCPYCGQVKGLMTKLEIDAQVVELDNVVEGSDVQEALLEITGSRTVPQVFVSGEYIGGCDDTMAAYRSGKLKEILEAAGVSSNL